MENAYVRSVAVKKSINVRKERNKGTIQKI